ncbi:uncharacterized protein [Triticum aestivum]|uniref:uncharacterized protein isoform X2 n=1 Tax=Triticum aestivum TaxID=4565 RepID=UPI001D00691C|nr:uncharacterized protein LOC123135261 isoform X2 [Triticum aestivum]
MWSGLLEHPSVDGEANRYLDLDPLLAGVGLVLCTVIESTTVTLLSFGPPLSLCLGRNLNRHRSPADSTGWDESEPLLSAAVSSNSLMYQIISEKDVWSYLH